MKFLFVSLLFSSLAFAGGGPDECVNCCKQPAPKCPKAKVVTKTVVKTVKVPVKEVVVEKVEVEKLVEKPHKKNTIALVLGGGIDRAQINQLSDTLYEIKPVNAGLVGARYEREIFDDYEIGITALTTPERLSSYKSIVETGEVSFGVKF